MFLIAKAWFVDCKMPRSTLLLLASASKKFGNPIYYWVVRDSN